MFVDTARRYPANTTKKSVDETLGSRGAKSSIPFSHIPITSKREKGSSNFATANRLPEDQPGSKNVNLTMLQQKLDPVLLRRLGLVAVGSAAGYLVGRWMRSDPVPAATSLNTSSDTVSADSEIAKTVAVSDDTALTKEPFLPQMTDALFESADDLCVFLLASSEELVSRRAVLERFIERVRSVDLPARISFSYIIRPSSSDDDDAGEDATTVPKDNTISGGVPVLLYKGQRKTSLFVWDSDEQGNAVKEALGESLSPFEVLTKFFHPVSEEDELVDGSSLQDLEQGTQDIQKVSPTEGNPNTVAAVPNVTYKTFEKQVIESSSQDAPILLQLMEDTCFLCFLMRPFINTVNYILVENQSPLRIKRLNLNKNDFPPGCPIVRSTPNFIVYRGPDSVKTGPPKPWKEYKPKEVTDKLIQEFNLSDSLRVQLEAAVDKLQERFQKFGLLSLWTQELITLQKLHEEGLSSLSMTDADVEAEYASIVSDLVKQDVQRNDRLEENIEHLDRSIASIEADCMTFAKIIGSDVLEKSAVDGSRRFELIKARLAYGSPLVPQTDSLDEDNDFNGPAGSSPAPASAAERSSEDIPAPSGTALVESDNTSIFDNSQSGIVSTDGVESTQADDPSITMSPVGMADDSLRLPGIKSATSEVY